MRAPIRSSAFLGKEIFAILRQPREIAPAPLVDVAKIPEGAAR